MTARWLAIVAIWCAATLTAFAQEKTKPESCVADAMRHQQRATKALILAQAAISDYAGMEKPTLRGVRDICDALRKALSDYEAQRAWFEKVGTTCKAALDGGKFAPSAWENATMERLRGVERRICKS